MENPLWLFAEIVDVALESDGGDPQILEKAIGIPACGEQSFD
jgi:hypothetical protein